MPWTLGAALDSMHRALGRAAGRARGVVCCRQGIHTHSQKPYGHFPHHRSNPCAVVNMDSFYPSPHTAPAPPSTLMANTSFPPSTTNIKQQNTVSSISHKPIHRIVNSLRNSSTTRNFTTFPERNSLPKNSIHLHRRGGNKAPSRTTRTTQSISFLSGVEGLECHQIHEGSSM